MVVQRTFIFILLLAAHVHCLSPSRSSQKSEATRVLKDAKAQISRKKLMVVPTPFLPPTKTISMKKIGARLKSSKPKTFAFSRNSFRFNTPVISKSNLQINRKQDQKPVSSMSVVAKQSINKIKTVQSNVKNIRKIQTSKGVTKSTEQSNKKTESSSIQSVKTEPEAVNGVTPEALLVEQRRRNFKTGFSLQRVQSKLDTGESKLELGKLKEKSQHKISKPLTKNEKVHSEKEITTKGRTWMNVLTRSNAVQSPVRKEPTPRKSFSAKALKKFVYRPVAVPSSKITIKTDGIPASKPLPKIQQNLSSQQKEIENVASGMLHSGSGLSNDIKLTNENYTEPSQPLPMMNEAKSAASSSVQTDILKLHPMNIPLPPENSGMQTDITKLHSMNIPLPPEISDVQTDITKLHPMNIPLPPGEILDQNTFLNMHRKQMSLPQEPAIKPLTEPSLKVVERPTAPAPTQDNLINSIQSLARNLENVVDTNTIPQTMPKVKTIMLPVVKTRPVPSPVRNQNVILPIPIQRVHSELQKSGIGSLSSVSLPGVQNQPVSAARPFRPGFIPPPPPDSGFVPGQIRTPQGAWNKNFQRPQLPQPQPAKRMLPATLPVSHNQHAVPHHNYIQTKVPLSGVIPQPPGMILRESGRLSRPQNIRPFSQQQNINTAYLTKAPNKQHVQSPRNHFVPGPIRRPNDHHAATHHFDRNNLSHNPPQPTPQKFYDITPPIYDVTPPVTSTTQKPTPGPRRRPPKPRNFDPLKHIMKGKQAKTKNTKKAKTTAKARKPPEPPERTTSADPDRKNFNQKIFKNSFQKDYVNEQRGRHPLKNFMLEFERFMKNMDNYFDLSGMIEFKK